MASRSVEIRGRTKDEAIREALEELGVGREEVEILILEEGRSGVFGVGLLGPHAASETRGESARRTTGTAKKAFRICSA